MPLCVYCDADYSEQDAACSTCGRSTRLGSAYPAIRDDLVFVNCPGCGRVPVVVRQLRCEGGCDLRDRWDAAAGPAADQTGAAEHEMGRSRPLECVAPIPSRPAQRPDSTEPVDPGNQGVFCPHCHTGLAGGDRFCDHCGKPLANSCPACGARNRQGARCCSRCGVALLMEPQEELQPAPQPAGGGADPAAPQTAAAPVWSRWQLVTLASDGSEGQSFTLKEGANLVGCASPGEGIHPEVDLGPLDPANNVSRRHAIISVQGDRVFLADYPGSGNRGSRNGTWIDGARITSTPVEVTERSAIAFAQLRFRVAGQA